MTVNTQALVPGASKAGKPVDGGAGERGQSTSREAAAAFQALLQGMKKDDAGNSDSQPDGAPETDRPDGSPVQGNAEPGSAGTAMEQATGAVAFSTSNLVDALRQASQNALARKVAVGGEKEGAPETEPDPKAATMLQTPAAHAGLSLNAVLAGKQVQSQSPAANAPPGSAGSPVNNQMTGQGSVLVEGDGDGMVRTGTSSLFAQFGVEPEAVSDGSSRPGGQRSLLPEDAAGTVKVLRQETHFAPNMRLSPAQQVGDQVATAMKEMAAGRATDQAGLTAKAEGPVLKTLDIQLNPHELGTVKVSLRMVGDSVEVSLVTSRVQTAEVLKQDRQLLDQMLKATGFRADTITIQAGDDRITVQPGGNSSGPQTQNQNQNGSASGNPFDGQPQHSGGGTGQQQGRAARETSEDAYQVSQSTKGEGDEDGSRVSLSDGLYL
ncbi:flagellar hook-length control protein FliK [Roseibium sp. M-1]